MAASLIGRIGHRVGDESTQSDTGGEENLTYLVSTDAYNELKQDIVAATGVTYFSPHPDDPDKLSGKATIRNHNGEPLLWEVEFSFTSNPEREEEEEQNPIDRAVKIKVQRVQREHFIWQDKDGKAITTVVGEFFEDIPTKTISGRRILFEKNYTNQVEPSWSLTHDNTLNSAAVTIKGTTYAAKTLKMNVTGVTYDLFENNTAYTKMEWELEYNPEAWALKPVHRGYNELADDGGIVVPIKVPFTDGALSPLDYDNPKRRVPTAPWPLDASGAAITDPDLTPLEVLTFDIFDEADHTDLPGVT